jgi:WD40 repeat protein
MSAIVALPVSPADRVVCAIENALHIWDVSNRVCEAQLKGHQALVTCLVLLSDGRVASGSQDCSIRIWNISRRVSDVVLSDNYVPSTGQPVVTAIVELPDYRLASVHQDNTLRIWRTQIGDNNVDEIFGTVQPIARLTYGSPMLSIAALSDGRIVSGHEDGWILLWSCAGTSYSSAGKSIQAHNKPVLALAVLPDRRVASASQEKPALIIDINRAP